jgi:hypothetical protein
LLQQHQTTVTIAWVPKWSAGASRRAPVPVAEADYLGRRKPSFSAALMRSALLDVTVSRLAAPGSKTRRASSRSSSGFRRPCICLSRAAIGVQVVTLPALVEIDGDGGFFPCIGIGPGCKRSASIGLQLRCHRVRLSARARPKTGSDAVFRRNDAERVYPTEAAHNPEVAGSNPAPATKKGPGNRAFCLRVGGAAGTSASADHLCGDPTL